MKMNLRIPSIPRPRIAFTRQTLIKGLKGLEFLLGFLVFPIGVFGLAATTYGMLLFRMANLGGAMVEAIVIPVANTGMNGMIISGGVNIYPAEIEGILVNHPSVVDAAVFGIPNEDFGEEVKAAIELVDGVEPSDQLAEELIAFCRDHLAGYKAPRSIDFEKALPRHPTGKLLKRLLRDAYWKNRDSNI